MFTGKGNTIVRKDANIFYTGNLVVNDDGRIVLVTINNQSSFQGVTVATEGAQGAEFGVCNNRRSKADYTQYRGSVTLQEKE